MNDKAMAAIGTVESIGYKSQVGSDNPDPVGYRQRFEEQFPGHDPLARYIYGVLWAAKVEGLSCLNHLAQTVAISLIREDVVEVKP